MSSCCSPGGTCCGTNAFFTRWSRYYALRFRSGGLEPVQKYFLDGATADSVADKTVLAKLFGWSFHPKLVQLDHHFGKALGRNLPRAVIVHMPVFTALGA